jgi:flagellar basal body-associated protein FliL
MAKLMLSISIIVLIAILVLVVYFLFSSSFFSASSTGKTIGGEGQIGKDSKKVAESLQNISRTLEEIENILK